MSDSNGDVQVAPETGAAGETDRSGRRPRLRLWVNWVSALLTIPAAAVVLVFALGAVMSTAGCSDRQCPHLGPSGIGFGVLFYGAPVVALAAIVISFVTARRRWGIVVPLVALALLAADIVILLVTVVQ